MSVMDTQLERATQLLDPRRSLRARMALIFGTLLIVMTIVQIVLLGMTAVPETLPAAQWQALAQRQIGLFGFVLTPIFVIVSWVLIGTIVNPLRLMAEVAQELQTGRQTQVIPTFPGRDEVASLSRSLNILVANLNTQQKALQKANETLEQRVAERTHQLTALYTMLELSRDFVALPVILERSLRQILDLAHIEQGMIHLTDSDGRHLTLTTYFHLTNALTADYAQLPLDTPLIQEILQQESHLFIPDLWQAPRLSLPSAPTPNGQWLFLPIQHSGRLLGLLTLMAPPSSVGLEENIPLFLSLVNQLGVTIENAQLRQRAEQLLVVEERNRLARELHDSVTQSLYSATLFAEAGLKQAQNGRFEKTLSYLEDVLQASRQALKEMRLLVYRLRPFSLDEGLVSALQHRLKAVEGRAGIGQQLEVKGAADIPADVEETLYYIAVEALNNALKHAQATAVEVLIDQDETAVTLQVKDNGQGFDTAAAVSSGGLGLTSMKERVAPYGGTVKINSAVHQGTTITVTLPVRALRRKHER